MEESGYDKEGLTVVYPLYRALKATEGNPDFQDLRSV